MMLLTIKKWKSNTQRCTLWSSPHGSYSKKGNSERNDIVLHCFNKAGKEIQKHGCGMETLRFRHHFLSPLPDGRWNLWADPLLPYQEVGIEWVVAAVVICTEARLYFLSSGPCDVSTCCTLTIGTITRVTTKMPCWISISFSCTSYRQIRWRMFGIIKMIITEIPSHKTAPNIPIHNGHLKNTVNVNSPAAIRNNIHDVMAALIFHTFTPSRLIWFFGSLLNTRFPNLMS